MEILSSVALLLVAISTLLHCYRIDKSESKIDVLEERIKHLEHMLYFQSGK